MRTIVFIFLVSFSFTASKAQESAKNKGNKKNYYVQIDSGFSATAPDRGEWMRGYFEQDSMVRIETLYGFNFGDLQRDFYYWNGNLIMVTETQRLYNNSASNKIDPDTVKPNYEGRYLFTKNILTSVKQNGSFSFMDTPADKKTMQETFLTMSANYAKLVMEKRKKKKNRIRITE